MSSDDSAVLDVSVVAANYNNADFLQDFFESWLESSHQPNEIIFVDDGSVDNSVEIARAYQSRLPNLRIIELGSNHGFGNALNAGISLSNSKYILRIDPDDACLPERIFKQHALLEASDTDVVGSNALIFQSATGVQVGVTNFPVSHADIDAAIRRGEHGVLHPTVMARADLFKCHLYVQENVPAEDYDIFARMLRSGARFSNIPEPLLRYRIHQRSASNVLPLSTIEKTYRIRDGIFGTSTSRFSVLHYYLHIKSYRKSIFATSLLPRILFLAAASALRPDKAIQRVARAFRIRFK